MESQTNHQGTDGQRQGQWTASAPCENETANNANRNQKKGKVINFLTLSSHIFVLTGSVSILLAATFPTTG